MQGIFKSSRALSCALLLLVVAGCVTANKVWPGRVGNYTYDQAVIELGPPDKQAKLEDGTLVADWLTQHSYNSTHITPSLYHSYSRHGFYGAQPIVTETYSPDYFLRLVFGTDGKLQSWKQFAR